MNRWHATAYTCLTVSLYVAAPATVELITADRVRVDRVVDAGVERHTQVLSAGANLVALTPGTYVFRVARDVQVNLNGSESVHVVAAEAATKTNDPKVPAAKGDSAPDRAPNLTVRR